MLIVDVLQGSDEWRKEKLGKPSASNISKIITSEGKPSTQRQDYLYELAGEIITGTWQEGYKNSVMETGNEREEESRGFLELVEDITIQKVGVVYKNEKKRFLCSPDGLGIGFGAELKNPLPKTQVKYLLKGTLPTEYFGQVQMSLYITGFNFWYFLSYVPAMRPLLLKVEPDKSYQKALERELNLFCEELEETVKKIGG